MHGPTHSPTTHNTRLAHLLITTHCTYWVLIQPDQRALITPISEWRLHWVGTTPTNKTLYARLQVLMCVYKKLCVVCLECHQQCTLELECAHDGVAPGAPEQCYSLSPRYSAEDDGHPRVSHQLSSLHWRERPALFSMPLNLLPSFFLFLCHSCCLCLSQFIYLLGRKGSY